MKKQTVAFIVALAFIAALFFGAVGTTLAQNESVKGDVNGDGKVNVTDCVCIVKASNDSMSYNKKADINYDGFVTSEDAQILAQYIAKIRPTLPKDPNEGKIETDIIF